MLAQDPFAFQDLLFPVFCGQLPKCSELVVMIRVKCNLVVATYVFHGLPLDQCLCHTLLTKVMHVHIQLGLIIIPTGPLLLLDLLLSSCLSLKEPCRLAFGEHRVMTLACMQGCGMCYKFVRGEGAQEFPEDLGISVVDHDSNDDTAQERFNQNRSLENV